MGSFLLSNQWEASYSLGSFPLTGKLPDDWKAPFSLGSILLIGNFHPTEKIPSHREVSLSLGSGLFTGMLLPPGKLFTTTKLLTMLIFNRKLHSPYHLLGKYTLLPRQVHVSGFLGSRPKFFEKVGFFENFPVNQKNFPVL